MAETDTKTTSARTAPSWARMIFVVVGLVAWFYTQWLLGQRTFTPGDQRETVRAIFQWLLGQRTFPSGIGDAGFEWTAGWHQYLLDHPAWADWLLIISSAWIDALGIFLLAWSVFGRSLRPFLALLIIFVLRQTCQSLCALPAPEGMIWHDPGFKSLLVTYPVSNDFFFSGHTGLAVLGAVELWQFGGRWLGLLGVGIAVFESVVVIVLRAHYTMDVFTGAVVALLAAGLAARFAPWCDQGLSRLFQRS